MNTTTQTTSASPCKLRSGAWGAKVQGSVRQGDTVRITTRAGKTWTATVTQVVWSGQGVTICATESQDRRPAASRRPQYGQYGLTHCGYPCPVSGRRCTANDPCHDCQ